MLCEDIHPVTWMRIVTPSMNGWQWKRVMMMQSGKMLSATSNWWCLIVTVAEATLGGVQARGEARHLVVRGQGVATTQWKVFCHFLRLDRCEA
jgi:hypothetical protein